MDFWDKIFGIAGGSPSSDPKNPRVGYSTPDFDPNRRFLARAMSFIWVAFQPKIWVGFYVPPKSSICFSRVWNHYFHHPSWVFSLIFGNTHFCSSELFVTEVSFLELAGCREMMEFPWGTNQKKSPRDPRDPTVGRFGKIVEFFSPSNLVSFVGFISLGPRPWHLF